MRYFLSVLEWVPLDKRREEDQEKVVKMTSRNWVRRGDDEPYILSILQLINPIHVHSKANIIRKSVLRLYRQSAFPNWIHARIKYIRTFLFVFLCAVTYYLRTNAKFLCSNYYGRMYIQHPCICIFKSLIYLANSQFIKSAGWLICAWIRSIIIQR